MASSTLTPKTMRAIKIVGAGKAEIQEVPLPRMRDDYVLVKVKAVALNPGDWQYIHLLPTVGATSGTDLAGVVEEVGSKVTRPFSKGDRILGLTHGGNASEKEDGAFAQYAVIKGDISIKIPDNLTYEEAATLPGGIVTCGQALYQRLELPLPGSGKYGGYLLIYGASTASGTLAIQFAKLSGADVVAICSPRNFDLVKSLGASAVFDYHDPECAKKVREYTKDSLYKVFDCIAEGSAPKICEDAISSKGGEICALLEPTYERTDIVAKFMLGYTATGETFVFDGKEYPANPADFEFAKKFFTLAAKLLADGSLKPHPADVRTGGLQGIFGGLDDLKNGRVSAKKLVYDIE